MERLHREVVIVAQLDHPYIVKFHEVIETPSVFYMVFDYAVGGELYDVICVRRFSEPEARGKFYQLISAILYCHSRGIIHRDLKVHTQQDCERSSQSVWTDAPSP